MDRDDLLFTLRAAPAAVFVDLLREAGVALTARALKSRLEALGVAPADVAAAWRRAQPGVRRHANVVVDGSRGAYVWSADRAPLPAVTAEEALDRVLPGRLTARRAALAEIVRAALKERSELEARVRGAYHAGREALAARDRQVRVDAVRALAAAAMEVAELAAAGAGGGVIAERVQALARLSDLTPIGRVGEVVPFDPRVHTPVGRYPAEGGGVSVIRPGYFWHAGGQDVLIGKAHVVAPRPDPG